jgi:Fic family protein
MSKKPFTPSKLPLKNLDWVSYISLIGDARDRLSKFDGLLQGIPNPNVLLSPLTTQEAVVSSKIEGTQATLEEVLEYEANPKQWDEKKDDILEVLNYRKAMYFAIDKMRRQPFSERLLKDVHKILLENARSNTKEIGEYRDWQVFIGKKGTTIEEASFIPPQPQDINGLMSNWEKYIHSKEKDPLVQLAIVHAQFEMIHPFGDGNGRLGRIILPIFLNYKGVLSTPMFYLSAYFEKHRETYYAKLNNISANSDWDSWILYFLSAIKEQSELNIEKAKAIMELYADKKEEIKQVTNSKYSVDILDFLFSYPLFSTTQFAKQTRIKPPYSNQIIKKLEEAKVIKLFRKGTGSKPNVYLFPDLLIITG